MKAAEGEGAQTAKGDITRAGPEPRGLSSHCRGHPGLSGTNHCMAESRRSYRCVRGFLSLGNGQVGLVRQYGVW